MSLLRVIEWFRRHLRGVVRAGWVVLGILVLLDAIPAVVDKEHAHSAAERIPGFWAVFGLVGCLFLILASKAFGHAGVMQREDYYDE